MAGLFVCGGLAALAVVALIPWLAERPAEAATTALRPAPRPEPVTARPLGPDAPLRLRSSSTVELVAALELRARVPTFGGLSGLLVEGDRATFVADRGLLWTADLVRDAAGRLIDLRAWAATPVRLPDRRLAVPLDIEDIARLPGGTLAVTTEQRHRIIELDADGRRPLRVIELPPPLADAPDNEGAEALVDLPDGSLLAIAEAVDAAGLAAAIVVAGEGAVALAYRPEPGHKVTGATRWGDRLFVLERRVSLLAGVSAVIKELAVDRVVDGTQLDGEIVARLDAAGFGANLEGIAAAPAPGGGLDLYLVSDDDFGLILPTVMLQLRLRPTLPGR